MNHPDPNQPFREDRRPQEATLGEFVEWQELLTEAGRQIVSLDEALINATERRAARDALRRSGLPTPDSVGRGTL